MIRLRGDLALLLFVDVTGEDRLSACILGLDSDIGSRKTGLVYALRSQEKGRCKGEGRLDRRKSWHKMSGNKGKARQLETNHLLLSIAPDYKGSCCLADT